MNDIRLRHAILIALGLPAFGLTTVACGGANDEPESPRAARRPDPTPEALPPTDPSCKEPGEACVYDETGCGADASTKSTSFYTGTLRGKSWTPGDPTTLAGMRFDAERTRAARAHAQEGQDARNFCCYAGCPKYIEGPPEAAIAAPHGDFYDCVVPPESTLYPAKDAPRCPASISVEGTMRGLHRFDADQDVCCYPNGHRQGHLGRPLRDGDVVTRVASRRGSHAKVDHCRDDDAEIDVDAIDVSRLDPTERTRIAAHWHEAALVEHASVAAFSKISLELLAFGAPAELVRDAHQAAIDELAHAALCSRIAARFGSTVVPGAHAAAARVVPHAELAAFVRETIEDGCVGEAQAALEAWRAAASATDPVLAQAYTRIAEDESRHAVLAWRIVQWALDVDASLASVIADSLDSLEAPGGSTQTIRSVARPCLAALLGDGAPDERRV